MTYSGSTSTVRSKARAESSRRPRWKSEMARRKWAGADIGLSSIAWRASDAHSAIAPRR